MIFKDYVRMKTGVMAAEKRNKLAYNLKYIEIENNYFN